MKLLTKERYGEYEEFLKNHKKGHFLQSVAWARVKDMWKNEIVIAEDENGKIIGGMSLLIRKIPIFNKTIMYAARGPVCDIYDKKVIKELVDGAIELSKKYNSYVLKIDPDVPASDEKFCAIMRELGFKFKQSKNFEGVQPRFVFRKNMTGATVDSLLSGEEADDAFRFESKHRYNVRVAIKKGVEVKIGTREDLPEFCRVMVETGLRDGFMTRSLEYFEKMYDEMGDNLRLYLCYYQGKMVSGAVAIYYGDKVWYLYGASSNEHRNVMPNYLMQYEMMKWAIEMGCDIYDFRGVSGDLEKGNPLHGLYKFKKGFNAEFVEFVGALDYVINPVFYFAVEKGERAYRELRRRMFLRKNRVSDTDEKADN